MKKMLFGITLCLVAGTASSQETAKWNDKEICRAATKSYFFLKTLPKDRPSSAWSILGNNKHSFVSAAGNVYNCAVNGAVTEFDWVKDGRKMTSKSTTFVIKDHVLHVKTDTLDETFELSLTTP